MNSLLPPSSPFLQLRASTGITGLDDVLRGGLPCKHLYLVEGNPGAGKTTLGLQFLLEGRAKGEAGLYITLSETKSELHTVAASHGWSLEGLSVYELVNQEGLGEDAEQTILHPSEVELGETTRDVMAAVEAHRPKRVVFDSLSEMRLLAQNPLRYRRQILALKHFFHALDCTVLMLDDKTAQDGDLQLHSIAHGVLSLEQTVDGYGPERRRLRVIKLRGVKFRGGEHDFSLDTGGLAVYPRLIAAEHRAEHGTATVSTGNLEFDAILGGGLVRGSNILFCGPSGVGKTTTALACVVAALQRGERAAYYLFDEGLNTLLIRAKALNILVAPYLASGHLQIIVLDPAEVSPGQFVHLVRAAVEERGAGTIVVDSINAYLQSMPGSKYLLLQMHELLMYLNQRGVVTIQVLGQHGVLGETRSDVDLSYLSDGMLMFRFFEAHGNLLKSVAVIKSRTHKHEPTIREFRLTPEGIQVGPALADFEGVLSGLPSYKGAIPLLGHPVLAGE